LETSHELAVHGGNVCRRQQCRLASNPLGNATHRHNRAVGARRRRRRLGLAAQADHTPNARDPHREHLRDRSGCVAGRINFARTSIAALAQHAGAKFGAPGPVLRVDHEQAGRTNQHVVDVGLRATGPPAVVDP
jgi:hypothetical protein